MKWQKVECSDGVFFVCEKCGRKSFEEDTFNYEGYRETRPVLTQYCPWCGTKLEKKS